MNPLTCTEDTAPMTFRNSCWVEQQGTVSFKCSYTEDIQTLLQTIKDMNMIKM